MTPADVRKAQAVTTNALRERDLQQSGDLMPPTDLTNRERYVVNVTRVCAKPRGFAALVRVSGFKPRKNIDRAVISECVGEMACGLAGDPGEHDQAALRLAAAEVRVTLL